jgi:hypothetical protein
MTWVPLEEVAQVHGGGRLGLSGKNFVEHGVPAYGAAGLNGYLDTAEYQDRNAVILSAIGARCGKCFLATGAWTSLANTQVILPDEQKVDARFLWHQLNEESRWPRQGAAQPFIKPRDVKTHRIWLPSLDEQRKIAGVLDAISAQKSRHDSLHTLLDELTRELFIESFGDPASSASWPSVGFDDVFEDITKHTTKVKTSEYLAAGLFPIVDQGQQSVAGYTNDPSLVFHPDEPLILFGDHTRTVKLIEQPFVLGADGVKVLKVASGFDPTFIEWHLRIAPVESLGYSRHMKLLKRQSYLSPPLALQQQFRERVHQARVVDDDLVQARALTDELALSTRTLLFAGS